MNVPDSFLVVLVSLIHAVIGWGLCGAIIGIGRKITTLQITLIAHAIGVPIIYLINTWIYFMFFADLHPFTLAVGFVLFACIMDLLVVSLLIEKNFSMFKSLLGFWIPIALMFSTTFFTGLYLSQ